jgi:hypothetical protein
MRKSLAFLALAIAAVCTTACHKDKPEVGTTQTTSSEIDLAPPATTPSVPPVQPKDDYLSAVRREQIVLRGRIDEELRSIDRQLGELRQSPGRDPRMVQELTQKRETLEADATVVDRADERGWDELKAVVEHDLEGQPQM